MEQKRYKIAFNPCRISDFPIIGGCAPITENLEEYNAQLEQTMYKELFGSVTKYLYEHKTVCEKRHISYDVINENGENVLIDLLDRKALAQYVKADNLENNATLQEFLTYLRCNTIDKAKKRLTDVLQGLLDGLTYQEISDVYGYKLSTIGKDVQSIRTYYKEFYGLNRDIEEREKAIVQFPTNWSAYHKSEKHSQYVYTLYFPINDISKIEEHEKTEKLKLAKTFIESAIIPKKADFEKNEKLYQARKAHCQKRSIRSNVLRYEKSIIQELERMERYNKPIESIGDIRYIKKADCIEVYYGDTFIRSHKIAN